MVKTSKAFKESHMLRDWLLTVGVRQNQKKHMLSKSLPNILSTCLVDTCHDRSYLTSVDYRHVSDGELGFVLDLEEG
jgi:hypothetical protein